ncbi:MAG: type II toxin-antitoxin system VapC family toxin [Candidatus Bathyarchaeia archaeon]
MPEVTPDSCVLVSAFVEGDEFRPHARKVVERVFSGEYHAVTSAIVPVEVCGVIARRSGVDKAKLVRDQMEEWEATGLFKFKDLTRTRRDEARDLSISLGLRGMDAIVVQVARETNCSLITFDDEVANKAVKVVQVLTHRDL